MHEFPYSASKPCCLNFSVLQFSVTVRMTSSVAPSLRVTSISSVTFRLFQIASDDVEHAGNLLAVYFVRPEPAVPSPIFQAHAHLRSQISVALPRRGSRTDHPTACGVETRIPEKLWD